MWHLKVFAFCQINKTRKRLGSLEMAKKYREELFDDDYMIIAECSEYTLVGNRKDLHDPYVGNLSERTCDCWYPTHH